ncbi:MAG TPA: amidase [Kineosporiaceae bacterium]|nr:amidase [Kineosporiaceae bacterium]
MTARAGTPPAPAAGHDAVTLAALVRSREVSPVELVDDALARLERLDPLVGAFTHVGADAARAQARAAEVAARAAAVTGEVLGPLHGVPVALKDTTATAGEVTSWGSAALRDHVTTFDANIALRLRAAGTISVGKTTTPEFGLYPHSEPAVAPPSRTPWDLTRSAGGSSGGAAAAVAAGIVPIGQGADTGGSLRIPASACGVFGLKPSRGRVSSGPRVGDPAYLTAHGVVTGTVRDTAAVLDAVAGPMPGDLDALPAWPAGAAARAVRDDPRGLRIGRYRTPADGGSVHPDCVAAWERASTALAEAGHEVEDVDPPFGPGLVEEFLVVYAVLAAAAEVPAGAEDLLQPTTRHLRERGRRVAAVTYLGAWTRLQDLARAAVAATAGYDLLLSPTLPRPPMPVGGFSRPGDPEAELGLMAAFAGFTYPYNLTGAAVASLPVHVSAEGLPIGVQLAAPRGGDLTVLAVAAQLERAGWPVPPVPAAVRDPFDRAGSLP